MNPNILVQHHKALQAGEDPINGHEQRQRKCQLSRLTA